MDDDLEAFYDIVAQDYAENRFEWGIRDCIHFAYTLPFLE